MELAYGGDREQDNENLPPIMGALAIAAFIIFFILLGHFRRISIALLIFASMTLCLFGTAVGVLIQGVDFSMTSTLGIISLMGIIVRNGIIMIDYAEELRTTEKCVCATPFIIRPADACVLFSLRRLPHQWVSSR